MRDFNFKSNSIVIFLYVLENLSSFNQVFFPRCMHFFSQKYAIFLKNMQFFSKICNFFSKICNFFSKICNFSQKYAIFSQKICIGKCLKFSYTYKKKCNTDYYIGSLHNIQFTYCMGSGHSTGSGFCLAFTYVKNLMMLIHQMQSRTMKECFV